MAARKGVLVKLRELIYLLPGPARKDIMAVVKFNADVTLEAITRLVELATLQTEQGARIDSMDQVLVDVQDKLDRLHAEVKVLIRDELDAHEAKV